MTPDGGQSRQHLGSWWLWIGYWVGLFVVTHVPLGGKGPTVVPFADKLVHFGLYFVLVALGGRHLFATGRGRSLALLLTWAVVYAAYGAVDEWLQQFVGRTMSAGDWLADLTGVAAATVVLTLRRPAPSLSEHDEKMP